MSPLDATRVQRAIINTLPVLLLAIACTACADGPARPPGASTAPRDLGSDLANALQARYDNQAVNCGATAPAFLCSGVLLRSTAGATKPWDAILPNNYGVSFSFLRQDANFSRLAGNATNGFIFYPGLQQPATKTPVEVLCGFPLSAGTEQREEAGCGAHRDYPQTSDKCHRLNITDASEWLAHYNAANVSNRNNHQCGFTLDDAGNAYSVQNFNALLLAHRFLNTTEFNELRLRTWETDTADTLPVEAFFYLEGSNGLSLARRDQAAFKLASGGMVKPVVRITLPSDPNGRARFTYLAGDQSEPPVHDPTPPPYPRQVIRQCPSYIVRATWIVRNDGISLAVDPTACARTHIPAAERAFAVDELFAKWASDTRFTNPAGMRDQYLCHMKNAPNEAQWNLEPWRPHVGAAMTEAAYCNPN